jgi:MoaA/NifB/PqqE/SkfB family radical SAM enzyme
MCHAWKITDHSQEATLAEFDRITKDPAFSDLKTISISGGEPYLRDDLVDLCRIFRINLGDKYYLIPTNSVAYKRVFEKAYQISQFMNVNVCMSLDGVGEVHNQIRGVKNLFNKWLWLEHHLRANKVSHDISCTIIRSNLTEIGEVKKLARELGLGFSFRPAADVASDYFEMTNNQEAVKSRALQKYIYQQLCDLKENEMTSTDIATLDMLRTGKRPFPCGAGYFSVIIMANLDVYPCSHCTWKMGNLRDFDYSLSKLLDSPKAKRIRRQFVDNCKACINDIEFPATMFAGGTYFYLKRKRGIKSVIRWLKKCVVSS